MSEPHLSLFLALSLSLLLPVVLIQKDISFFTHHMLLSKRVRLHAKCFKGPPQLNYEAEPVSSAVINQVEPTWVFAVLENL